MRHAPGSAALVRLLAALALSLSACARAEPVVVTPFERVLSGGVARGYVAKIDLRDPAVEIVVTDPLAPGEPGEARLIPTPQWRDATGCTLAVNANFFGNSARGYADIIGLSVSDGVVVSPPRRHGTTADPAVAFAADGSVTIGYFDAADLAAAHDAVAGVGPSASEPDLGTLLVSDGVNTGSTARVQPKVRHPRTAVGIDRWGSTLLLVTVDGRQAEWSVGMTLPELGQLLLDHGAWRAVALDGGGSTSFVHSPKPGVLTINRPSDGKFRPVANHLGVRLRRSLPPPLVPPGDRADRPIRGVWMRPPATLAELESRLPTLAAAGITDLFLETFYHGLATNDSSVFQDRFATDFLRDAIVRAARHNIRVHAWIESSYWQYGTTGAYLFQANPEYRVKNLATGGFGGDQAGQVFANLAHPGVQQKMASYCAELAAYPGLWGIQTDYHRYPLDNDTADAYPAPWSYDVYSQQAMFGLYATNISSTARFPGDPYWTQFVAWRREGISQAANAMQQAINAVNPGVEFSAAVFARAMTDTTQLTKMQDWPSWALRGYIDWVVPMAYGLSTSSISSDLAAARNAASGRRVVAGLAIIAGHPSISTQLATAKSSQIEDFILFDAPTLLGSAAMQNELRGWLLANATKQQGDLNNDLYVDARDLAVFRQTFHTSPVQANARNRRLDLDSSGVIDFQDQVQLVLVIRRNAFGEDGVLDQADARALRDAMFAGGAPGQVLPLYDLDGDGSIDELDEMIFRSYSQPGVPVP